MSWQSLLPQSNILKSCANINAIHQFLAKNNVSLSLCDIVQDLNECDIDGGFINYTRFAFCFDGGVALATIILVICLVLVLLGLATNADIFFSPNLVYVTQLLQMSQNLAGVTLLALGNGAADIFSSISAVNSMKEGDVGLVFGALLGAGLAVNCITASTIMIVAPFQCARRPVIKDLLFYGAIMSWIFTIIYKGKIFPLEAFGFVIVYLIYVTVTVAGSAIYKKINRNKEKFATSQPDIKLSSSSIALLSDATYKTYSSCVSEPHAGKQLMLPVPRFHPTHASEKSGFNIPAKSKSSEIKFTSSFEQNVSLVPKRLSLTNSFTKTDPRSKRMFSTSGFSSRRNYLARWMISRESLQLQATQIEFEDRRCSLMTSSPSREREKVRHFSEVKAKQRSISSTTPYMQRRDLKAFQIDELTSQISSKPRPSLLSPNIIVPTIVTMDEHGEVIDEWTAREECGEEYDLSEEVFMEKLSECELTTDSEDDIAPQGMIREFFNRLVPIDVDDWTSYNWFEKLLELVKSPFVILFRLTIPLVDLEQEMFGWSKILNSLHCLTTPCFILLATKMGFIEVAYGINVLMIATMLLPLIILLVWLTSVSDKPPIYHWIFALIGFITSIVWIFTMANEVVNILTTIGIVTTINPAILGLTLLAWANSTSDMLSNIMLARNGYPRIGYSACIGGPLFNSLIGIGVPFTIKAINTKAPIMVQANNVLYVISLSTLVVFSANIICIPLKRFKLNWHIGLVLLSIYFLFMLLVILVERGMLI